MSEVKSTIIIRLKFTFNTFCSLYFVLLFFSFPASYLELCDTHVFSVSSQLETWLRKNHHRIKTEKKERKVQIQMMMIFLRSHSRHLITWSGEICASWRNSLSIFSLFCIFHSTNMSHHFVRKFLITKSRLLWNPASFIKSLIHKWMKYFPSRSHPRKVSSIILLWNLYDSIFIKQSLNPHSTRERKH